MLDAIPAADASARPAAHTIATPPPGPDRLAGAPALHGAARTLLPALEAGRPLDAAALRDAMTRAHGASDADGAWVWKDAYEAAEAAVVLFVRRYGRATAPAGRRGRGRPPQDAGHARGRRRAGALAHQALRGAGPAPAVLDAAAARLRRIAGRRRPAGRRRSGAQRRHRHARRDGGVRARQGRVRAAVSERDRGGPRRASRGALSRHRRHPPHTPRRWPTSCRACGRPSC